MIINFEKKVAKSMLGAIIKVKILDTILRATALKNGRGICFFWSAYFF